MDGQEAGLLTLPNSGEDEGTTAPLYLSPNGQDQPLSAGLHAIRILSVNAGFYFDDLSFIPS